MLENLTETHVNMEQSYNVPWNNVCFFLICMHFTFIHAKITIVECLQGHLSYNQHKRNIEYKVIFSTKT